LQNISLTISLLEGGYLTEFRIRNLDQMGKCCDLLSFPTHCRL